MAAVTQAEIDALESAIRRGVKSVSYGNDQVTYQSIADMRATLAQMKREQAGGRATGRSYPTYTKGV